MSVKLVKRFLPFHLLIVVGAFNAYAIERPSVQGDCANTLENQDFASILRDAAETSRATEKLGSAAIPSEKPIQLAALDEGTVRMVGTAGNLGIYLVTVKVGTDANGMPIYRDVYRQGPIGVRAPGALSPIRQ